MSFRVLVMLAGAASALWAFSHWRKAVQYAMVMLILEGAIRKWVFPGSQDLVYFAKDVLLLGAYLGFLRDRPRLRYRLPAVPAFYAVLVLALSMGLLQIFNPNLPNLLVGAFGFKAYFFYVPLMFLLPHAFANGTELARFLRRYVLLSIPVGMLAVAQFLSPSTSILNTYARATDDTGYIATFGSSTYVRVTGTFAFISGYTAYLLVTAILILVLLSVNRWRLRGNILLFTALGMTLLGMLMTGSRGPVLFLVLLFPLYWWLAVIRERGGGATFGRLILALTLVGGLVVSAGEKALDAFYGRALGFSDVSGRVASPLLSPYLLLPDVGLFGFGIGATHQTAATLAPRVLPYSWLRGLLVEVESGRVMIELGPPGFLLVFFLRLYLAVFAFRQVMVLRTRFHRAIATACFLFFLTAIPGGVVFDVTAGVYYWFLAGLLMLVMRLDAEAVAQAALRASAEAAAGRPALQISPAARSPL